MTIELNGHKPALSETAPPGVWRGPQQPAEQPGHPVVPVDQDPKLIPGVLPWDAAPVRKPLAPVWLSDSVQRRAASRWAAGHLRWLAAFHLLRVPKYSGRAIVYVPRGLARAAVAWFRWLFDWDAHGLRLDLIQRREAGHYHTAARHRDDRVKNRALGSFVVAVLVVGVAVVALQFWPVTVWLGLVAAGLFFTWYGRPVGKPFLVDHAVLPTQVTRLTSDVVARALASIGIAVLARSVEKKDSTFAFVAPIVRDGPGWRAEVDLPYGVAAVDVIEKRAALSSALRRPLGCVWPEPVHEEHSGRLVLWVGDRPLTAMPPAKYPLLSSGETSIFKPLPFGIDQRGNPVTVCLMFASMACGAQPRMGKTFAIRLLALGAALDPCCELHIYDGKGMGDWIAFESVAHWFGSGSREETLLLLRDNLAALKREVGRRADLLTDLTRRGKCPEGKVTPELSKVKSHGLHPIVVVLDECHLAFETGSGAAGKLGDEIAEIAEYLVRVGPAAGVSLIAATQRPDAKSLPSGIRANVQLRFCLRVADQPTNDMVLGTSAYKNGVRATEFTLSDKGIGYLSGEGTVPVIMRTYNLNSDDSAAILLRARQLREDTGTLSGMAAGHAPARKADPTELLTDVLDAMGSEEKMWSEAICAHLADCHPGRYAGWDQTTLGKALRALGVATKQTWWCPPGGEPTNKNGVTRQQIQDALKASRTADD